MHLKSLHVRGSLDDSRDMHRVPTDNGTIMVAVHGDTSKPAILTYHDLGVNCKYMSATFMILSNDSIPTDLIYCFHELLFS